jgi:hypothetical protein
MQFVASVGLVVIGLAVALFLDTSADLRVFGWVLVVVGVAGLLSRWALARRHNDRPPR